MFLCSVGRLNLGCRGSTDSQPVYVQVFPTIYFAVSFSAYIQVRADPSTALDIELGYPCYIPSNEALQAHLPGHSLAIYSYLNYARALGESVSAKLELALTPFAVLLLLAITTLVYRERYRGRLTNVVTLDGGLYYLSTAGANA